MAMASYPVFLKLQGAACLVVGGGSVAERKVAALVSSGARVVVVAPSLSPGLARQARQGTIEWRAGAFPGQIDPGYRLVIAATDDDAINRQVYEACLAADVLVNVVDAPELSTFISPAVVDRSPLTIAISSDGQAPVLARLWRARLEAMIPANYGHLAAFAGRLREAVKARLPSFTERLRFWERILDGAVANLVLDGRIGDAEKAFDKALAEAAEGGQRQVGEVYLVGAGPGDPDLLTFRALRLMQRADVVLYDRLVSPAVLDLVRRDARRIYVGKARREHAMRQEEINALMVRLAEEGKRVLRLKGGDPFIFGRGGEEIADLAERRIAFQVVPGITAAGGCAAYAGIPLTHRDYAQSVQFITGHPRQDGALDLDWRCIARKDQTVVIYMGLAGLQHLCEQLIGHGLAPDYPAAIIQQGTTSAQRVVIGDLSTLPKLAAEQELHAPTLVIVGEVVRLHQRLAWFSGDPQVRNVFTAPRA